MTRFQNPRKVSGSNQITINVDRDGKPFGQIWTFKVKGEKHGWHAKTLTGEYFLAKTCSGAKLWIATR